MKRAKSPKAKKGKPIRSRKFPGTEMSYEEIYNIVVAMGVAALIFAYNWQRPELTFTTLPKALLAVLIAFAFQLPVQKLFARRFGCVAFYKLWLPGLVLSMLLMLVGIKVILIGAVSLSAYKFSRWGFKSRYTTMTEIGWVGVSGPIVNILLGAVFKLVGLPYFATVNFLIALFNLVPIKPLDGSKVFLWDPLVWGLLVFTILLIITPAGLLNYFASLHLR